MAGLIVVLGTVGAVSLSLEIVPTIGNVGVPRSLCSLIRLVCSTEPIRDLASGICEYSSPELDSLLRLTTALLGDVAGGLIYSLGCIELNDAGNDGNTDLKAGEADSGVGADVIFIRIPVTRVEPRVVVCHSTCTTIITMRSSVQYLIITEMWINRCISISPFPIDCFTLNAVRTWRLSKL